MKYSEKELAAIISEVEEKFGSYLEKAEAEAEKLEKSEEVEQEQENSEDLEKSEEFDYDEEDFEEMDKMYGSMTKAEKEAHYASIKKCLYGDEPAEESEMSKSEKTQTEMIAKSEFDSLKEENEGLKKNMEKLTNALAQFVKLNKAPKQKSVTEIAHIAKNETESKPEEKTLDLSKAEIKEKLSAVIRKGELSAKDREKINNYYLKNSSIETIKHLL